MKKKAARREHARRFTADGLPRDAREWTVDDWRDLYEAMEAARRRIAERHKRGMVS